jgi:hypothetical protein
MTSESRPPSWQRPGGAWTAGTVTTTYPPPPPFEPPPAPPGAPGGGSRRQLLIFGGVAAAIAVIGLVVVLVVVFSGDSSPFRGKAAPPTDVRPPLAQLCPAPSVQPGGEAAPAPATPPGEGARTVDTEAGISYTAYPAPWQPWDTTWRAGTLQVPYKRGQHFVTEVYSGGTYHASILSAAVPAADNDAVSLNLDCVGRQVAADVRAEYYPQPNTMEPMRDEKTTLGGRPAWVSKFRLHFASPGLKATSELVAVAIVDVGKPTAAVLYVSIPGTHSQYDWITDDALDSVRPT